MYKYHASFFNFQSYFRVFSGQLIATHKSYLLVSFLLGLFLLETKDPLKQRIPLAVLVRFLSLLASHATSLFPNPPLIWPARLFYLVILLELISRHISFRQFIVHMVLVVAKSENILLISMLVAQVKLLNKVRYCVCRGVKGVQ